MHGGAVYWVLLAIQVYGYLATCLYWQRSFSRKQPVWISLPAFFVLVHMAMILGASFLWLGKQTVLWETFPRNMDKVIDAGKND
jgi:ABC-type microcin C transport system permease subunit YejE